MINSIYDELFIYQDLEYKNFHERLCKTKYEIIGIRLPVLRRIAKEKVSDFKYYLENNYDKYYESVLLQGFIIGNLTDINEVIKYSDKFIKKVDNWAMCDSFSASLKLTKKYKEQMYKYVLMYKNSNEVYCLRFMFDMFIDYFLDKEYLDDIFIIIKNIKNHDYYVDMAIAWFLATSYDKYKEETIRFLKTANLNNFIIKKTISKVYDSYRVSKEDKLYIKNILK